MADNYLERKMDDYRAGRLNSKPSRPSVSRPTIPGPRIDDARLLVVDAGSELMQQLIRELRNRNLRVAFIAPQSADANKLAQQTGAQFHPSALPSSSAAIEKAAAYIAAHHDRITMVITSLDSLVLPESLKSLVSFVTVTHRNTTHIDQFIKSAAAAIYMLAMSDTEATAGLNINIGG